MKRAYPPNVRRRGANLPAVACAPHRQGSPVLASSGFDDFAQATALKHFTYETRRVHPPGRRPARWPFDLRNNLLLREAGVAAWGVVVRLQLARRDTSDNRVGTEARGGSELTRLKKAGLAMLGVEIFLDLIPGEAAMSAWRTMVGYQFASGDVTLHSPLDHADRRGEL